MYLGKERLFFPFLALALNIQKCLTLDCEWEGGSENVALFCEINYSEHLTQTLIQQVSDATQVTFQCSPTYQDSILLNLGNNISLSNIKILKISSCNVEIVDSVEHLPMKTSSRVLLPTWLLSEQLTGLSELDLSGSHISSLLPVLSSLCSVKRIEKLNLSRTNISTWQDISIQPKGSTCPLLESLQSLDLSLNSIPSFPGLTAPSLKVLNLENNQLKNLPEDSLYGLPSLTDIHLSNNQLSTLSPVIFFKSPTLQKMFLQNNSLSDGLISQDLFNGLHSLLLLNLSDNHLSDQHFPPGLLNDQVKLIALDLSHNKINRLDKDHFMNLNELQILNVQHNQISQISEDTFSWLPNLHVLMLSYNKIRHFYPNTFSNLSSLRSLSFQNNKLTNLLPDMFENTTNLEDLTLHHNKLRKIPDALRHLSNLKTLDLGENLITEFANHDLHGLTKLYGLRLSGNNIYNIPVGIFKRNINLNVLNLSHNRIRTIEEGSLKNLENLKALRLDNNELEDMNGLVSTLSNLRWLNVSTNHLKWFDFAFIPKSLEWLDIHQNHIKRIGNYYQLRGGYNLSSLDASFNIIENLDNSMFLTEIQHLYLNNNKISNISANAFISMKNLSRVELQDNQLSTIQMASLYTDSFEQAPEVLLAGNPMLCDCQLDWLQNIDRLSDRSGQLANILDIESLTCTHKENGHVVLLSDAGQLTCQYQAHCQPQCFCCDFYACDCRMQCPEGCTCYHDISWTSNIIQCSNRGHQDVPPLIPMDATSIYLDGNSMSELINPGFVGRRRVREVYLNHSKIERLTGLSFEGLTHVRELHLENNLLRQIGAVNEFSGLTHLRRLFLQNNELVSISSDTFSNLKYLSVLKLNGNKLSSFTIMDVAITNLELSSLYLANNPWSCDCETLHTMQVFIETSPNIISDRRTITCAYGSGALVPINAAVGSCDEVVDIADGLIAKQNDMSVNYTPILIAILLSLLLIIVLYLLVFTFRNSLKRFLHSRVKSNQHGDSEPISQANSIICDGKLFDLFISYAIEDRRFVEETFAPALEHGTTSYRLCLHQRDFPITTPIQHSVSVAVDSSSRTLICLSKPYIRYQWSLVRSVLSKYDPTKLLILYVDDLSSNDLLPYPDLQHLINSSQTICWGEGEGWSRLKSFLPEPVYLTFQRNVTLRSGGTLPFQNNKTYEPVQTIQDTDTWTYFKEDSLDTNTTDISDGANSPSASPLDHTYYSIDSSHLYHTLDPGDCYPEQGTQHPPRWGAGQAIFLTKDLYVHRPGHPQLTAGNFTTPRSGSSHNKGCGKETDRAKQEQQEPGHLQLFSILPPPPQAPQQTGKSSAGFMVM